MASNNIDLKQFIPKNLVVPKTKNEYPITIEDKESYYLLRYVTTHYNNANRQHCIDIPKFVTRSTETFEVLGLLQAEMGKTNNGCIVFANSEYKLVNKVITWFHKELGISPSIWRWYVRINLEEPWMFNDRI